MAQISETQNRSTSNPAAVPSRSATAPSGHAATADASRLHRFSRAFFGTPDEPAGLVLRLGLAAAMFPHGAQKALGWWGGFGFEATVGYFTQSGFPLLLTLAIIAAEFLGPIALAAGFFTRWSAFGIGTVMTGAALIGHTQHGFFMNWMGNQKGEGLEYFVLAVSMALALLLLGGGKWSVDRLLARKLSRGQDWRAS
jgi:putative oxidoreductase